MTTPSERDIGERAVATCVWDSDIPRSEFEHRPSAAEVHYRKHPFMHHLRQEYYVSVLFVLRFSMAMLHGHTREDFHNECIYCN